MKKFSHKIIQLYQLVISPFMGSHCRFYPSCSNYADQSIQDFGFVRGFFKTVLRLLRCHPFASGGFDPVRK